MNSFNTAFYNCDGGGAFHMAYDAARPRTAIMTTSNNNREYQLKRETVAEGVQFSDGATKFWTDGKSVRVEGTQQPYVNCQIKTG